VESAATMRLRHRGVTCKAVTGLRRLADREFNLPPLEPTQQSFFCAFGGAKDDIGMCSTELRREGREASRRMQVWMPMEIWPFSPLPGHLCER